MNKKEMDLFIEADLYRVYGSKGLKKKLKHLFKRPNHGFRYMYILRKCQYYNSENRLLFAFFEGLLKHYQFKYGLEILPSTKIGKGFYIGHVGGIIINTRTIIGDNVNILTGALIGYNPKGKYQWCPTIGNEVWIGPNAVIVGNIKVGNNVLIAPNTLVNRDVPDNSVVYGNPMIIKPSETATESYINYTV